MKKHESNIFILNIYLDKRFNIVHGAWRALPPCNFIEWAEQTSYDIYMKIHNEIVRISSTPKQKNRIWYYRAFCC